MNLLCTAVIGDNSAPWGRATRILTWLPASLEAMLCYMLIRLRWHKFFWKNLTQPDASKSNTNPRYQWNLSEATSPSGSIIKRTKPGHESSIGQHVWQDLDLCAITNGWDKVDRVTCLLETKSGWTTFVNKNASNCHTCTNQCIKINV